jgi:hypothetical protein
MGVYQNALNSFGEEFTHTARVKIFAFRGAKLF